MSSDFKNSIPKIERYIEKSKLEIPGQIKYRETAALFEASKIDRAIGQKLWDLIDINKSGILKRPQFVILLYLIKMGKQSVLFESLPKYCLEFLEKAEKEEKDREREAEESKNVEIEFRNCLPKLMDLLEKFQFQHNESEYYSKDKIKQIKSKVC